MLLFKTVHGSRLYRLAHENSDLDYYQVVETKRNRKARYAKQSIIDGVDTTTVDFGTWVNMCQSGVPQACEAMFSSMAVVDEISEFRNAFRIGPGVRDKYFRTIDNFLTEPDFKRNRHALRLTLNLRDALRYGRFNPTLSARAAVWVTFHAKHMPFNELREFVLDFANEV